jgi:hypothetical protein
MTRSPTGSLESYVAERRWDQPFVAYGIAFRVAKCLWRGRSAAWLVPLLQPSRRRAYVRPVFLVAREHDHLVTLRSVVQHFLHLRETLPVGID